MSNFSVMHDRDGQAVALNPDHVRLIREAGPESCIVYLTPGGEGQETQVEINLSMGMLVSSLAGIES